MTKSDGRYRGSRTPRLRPPECRFAHPSFSGSLRHLACRLGSLFEFPRTLHTVLSNVVWIQIWALYRQSSSDRLEKQPTDPATARRRHHYMRDGTLTASRDPLEQERLNFSK